MIALRKLVPLFFSAGIAFLLLAAFILTDSLVLAQEEAANAPVEESEPTPLHPTFPILDADGNHALETGKPISAMQTCGTCHDTDFIASHSAHAEIDGWYGEWNPITYLEPDLAMDKWVREAGWRHVGGGPAEEVGVEMNCFLCHYEGANNQARVLALETGRLTQGSSGTLCGTGIVNLRPLGCNIHQDAFDEDGNLLTKYVNIAEPSDAACGQCHGVVGEDAQIPLTFDLYDMRQWTTYTTGQVFSPQRISNSGMNIEDKTELARSWDVHAERVVNCVDCHYSLNNPVFYVEGDASRPDHLEFDPRRMEIGDYLERPVHQFANSSQHSDAFSNFEGAMRDCASCHDAESTHTWLAYPQRHMQAMQCETCHIPTLHAPALASVDWTVLDGRGEPVRTFRGVDAGSDPDLITGYEPVLLPDEEGKIAPYNLVSAWYWVSGEEGTPVPEDDLRAAYFANGTYHADVIAAFDTDGDGTLKTHEMLLDTDAEEAVIAAHLVELGHENPRIVAQTETYEIHHGVTEGEWAIRDCATCHTEDTRLAQAVALSDRTPGGVVPELTLDETRATLATDDTGALLMVPEIELEPVDLYILGHDSVALVDWAGILIFLATMAGVFVHGGLRVLAARRMPAPEEPQLREVYMYTIYERQWHWLQSALIFGLIFTGILIHKPHMLGFLSFRWMVLIHNAFALVLIINAALAAFYHLVSGEIKQFLPEPKGFFGQMFAQARYYAWGIFRGEPHPIEKTPERKLNPIQQLTYFGLLNVLLPLQVITGALMWGAQHFPGVTDFFGGLPFLAPFHTLIAWLLASFIVLHVYMTTTGHTPLANIRAMIFGWDEVETHGSGEHVQQPATGD